MTWQVAFRRDLVRALISAAAVAAVVAALLPLKSRLGLPNEGMLLLLVALVISATAGWRVGLLGAVLANLSLNYFFVEPVHTFSVRDASDIVALGVFLAVAIVGGSLLSSAQRSALEARRRQAETEVLLSISRAMLGRTRPREALTALCEEVLRILQADGAAVLMRNSGDWEVLAAAGSSAAERGEAQRPPSAEERSMMTHAFSVNSSVTIGRARVNASAVRRIFVGVGERAGIGAGNRRGLTLVPLKTGTESIGMLRIDGPIGNAVFADHPEQLLAPFAKEAASAVQRSELAAAAARAEALREADQMKTALMASVSHDLKTPLAGIKAAVSSLLADEVHWSSDDVKGFLETIDSQTDRLNRLISDILDLNRIESGAVSPVLRRVCVRAVLEEARNRTAVVTKDRVVSIRALPDLTALADESLLVQALVNLVENAARYSTPGGSIELTGEARDARVDIAVSDHGPGIASEHLPHLFERFYRVPERTPRAKGSGLGLSIVKGFVTLSGGTVQAAKVRDGMRFVISLPVPVSAPVQAGTR